MANIINLYKRVMIWFEGGAEPNPGASYGSYALFVPAANDHWPTEPVEVISRLDFGYGTNNEAEYKSLISGLEDISHRIKAAGQSLSAWQIEVRGDSDLAVKQIGGEWQVKKESLRPLLDEVRTLLMNFVQHTLTWHSRTNSVRVLGH